MFRTKIFIYFLTLCLSIFSLPFGSIQKQYYSHETIHYAYALHANFAPPVQPQKLNNTQKKAQKKRALKQQQIQRKNPNSDVSLGLLLVLLCYILGIVYFGLISLFLVILGIAFLLGGGAMLGGFWMGILILLIAIGLIGTVFNLVPIYRKFNKLKNVNFNPHSTDTILLKKTLWLGMGYLGLIFLTIALPILIIVVPNTWLVILISILLGAVYNRVKRKLNKNLDDLLRKIPQDNPTYNGNNIDNGNFNKDLLDEGY